MNTIYWDKTQNIFFDRASLTSTSSTFYPDDDNNEFVNIDYFFNIFSKIKDFTHIEEEKDNILIQTYDGPEKAMVKRWINENEKIEFMKTIPDDADNETGWGALYCNLNEILVVGNYYNHPFIVTQDFETKSWRLPSEVF